MVFTDSLTCLREWLLDLQLGETLAVEKLAACKGPNTGKEWQKGEDGLLQHCKAFYILNDPVVQQELL